MKILNLLPWRRRRLEHDLARELRDHMDRRVADLMQFGLSAAEARRQATLEFGSIDDVQEEVCDTWVWPALDHLIADARYAARRLRSRPAYTLLASLTLALGVGGTAAVYGIARGLLFDPLPYAHESEVGVFWKKTDWTEEEFLHVRDDFAVNARNEIVLLLRGGPT